jgi:hypothetical protein
MPPERGLSGDLSGHPFHSNAEPFRKYPCGARGIWIFEKIRVTTSLTPPNGTEG